MYVEVGEKNKVYNDKWKLKNILFSREIAVVVLNNLS